MANKQTAVQFLLSKVTFSGTIEEDGITYKILKAKISDEDIQQAKAMEKEQIKDAYRKGVINAEKHSPFEKINWEPYYKETYEKR